MPTNTWKSTFLEKCSERLVFLKCNFVVLLFWLFPHSLNPIWGRNTFSLELRAVPFPTWNVNFTSETKFKKKKTDFQGLGVREEDQVVNKDRQRLTVTVLHL